MLEEFIEKIKESKQNQNSVSKEQQKTQTFLTFRINEKIFAIPSFKIKEILKDSEVYPVPFVPPYIKGILNRYGDPYVVIDFASLLNLPEQKSSLFIVINDDSNSCLKVTDVKEFHSAKTSDLVPFSENDDNSFFEGTLLINGQEVFVINSEALLKKTGDDFESF